MTSDPLRTDAAAQANASSDVERDARIEQLLLAGLDHYFASQYDQAINIWTRALFFDRNHARARAYIERARRAQAERQRESEELLHNGALAYRRGDGREARRLLQAALDAGAPFEDAFPMLERLNQLEAVSQQPPTIRARSLSPAAGAAPREAGSSHWASRTAVGTALLVIIGAGVYGIVSLQSDWSTWPPLARVQSVPASPAGAREVTLGVPTNGELALASARSLMSGGDLRGALTALERVRPTDPQKTEADRLRADVQRQLIRAASESSDSGQDRRQ